MIIIVIQFTMVIILNIAKLNQYDDNGKKVDIDNHDHFEIEIKMII